MVKRIVKMLASAVLALSMLPTVNISAEGAVRVEGESYDSCNFSGGIASGADLSGGKLFKVQSTFPEGSVWIAEYTVTVPESGYYSMKIASTKFNFGYTNDYGISINDGEKIELKNSAKLISAYDPSVAKNIMGIYYAGTFKLNKGDNSVRIIMDKKNDRNSQATFYLDYFEFEKAKWGIDTVTARGPVGVFQESERILFDVVYSGTPESRKYSFEVRDYWAAIVLSGEKTVKKNTLSDVVNIGTLPKGWYKIELSDENGILAYSSFCVVPDYSKRTAAESPFAVDHASCWLVPAEKRPEYAKAIRLAGVNWARERFSWESTCPEPGVWNYGNQLGVVDILDREGVNVIDVYHNSPKWTHPVGNRQLPEDLFTTYEFNKKLAEDSPSVDVWEIWNEEDVTILYLRETAEQYAAHFKAAAIAMAETENNPYVVFGGFSQNSEQTEFIDLVFQNGIMDYTNIYNYHCHNNINDKRVNETIDMHENATKNQIASDRAYDSEGKPVWVTEAGGKMLLASVNEPTSERLQKGQARYVVASNVQSVAWGVDKNFWFVFPKYIENSADWGTFSENHTPYPSYQAEAIMTYALGAGKYLGEVNNLPEGVRGYVFDNGSGEDVCVLWSDSEKTMSFASRHDVKVTDFMGGEKNIAGEDGRVSINLCPDPVYVNFRGRMDSSEYTLEIRKEKKLQKNHFTKEQKIVLNQNYDGIDFIEGKQFGFRKSMEKPFEIQCEVYNFNDVEMSGVIRASAECNVTFDADEKPVTVAPMSKEVVAFTIQAGEGNLHDTLYDLKFVGEFNGVQTSPTVSHISFKYESDLDGIPLPNALDPDKYNISNVSSGTKSWAEHGDNPDEIKIGATMKKQGEWYYPIFPVDGEACKDYDGVSFWLKCSKKLNYDNYGFMNAFAYMNDGGNYFLGNKPVSFDDEWRYFYITWDNWVRNKSGTKTGAGFAPADITSMSFGFNATEEMEITIKNPMLFKLPKEEKPEPKKVVFDNVTDGSVLTREQAAALTATLPQDIDTEKTRVVVNSYDFDYKKEISADKLTADLSELPEGSYTLTVIAYTDTGYAIDGSVSFRIAE